MGNAPTGPPPPSGERILRCKKLFMLKKEDIEAFWEIFKQYDLKREGLISRQAFFQGIIQEERNEFGNAIFSLVDPEDEETLEFGEFVQAVCTFCCLCVTDMLKFCFMVYDKDRSGLMEMEELHHFIKVLHISNVSNNVQSAMSKLHLDDHGRLPFDSFEIMNKDFPQVLYPVFRLQQSTQRNILGTKWWKRKINELDYWRVNREHVEQMEKLKETKKRNRQRDAQIRKEEQSGTLGRHPRLEKYHVKPLSYPPCEQPKINVTTNKNANGEGWSTGWVQGPKTATYGVKTALSQFLGGA